MMGRLSTSTFKRLQTHEAFTNHPDVVEEYFFLIARVVNYCPRPLITSDLLVEAMRCAVVGMLVQHPAAQEGVLKFLESSIGVAHKASAEEKAALERAIGATGESIILAVCKGLVCDVPIFAIDGGAGSLAGVMFKLNVLAPDMVKQWVQNSLAVTGNVAGAAVAGGGGRGNEKAVNQAKGQFFNVFGVTNGRTVGEEEFYRKIREFHNTCYRAKQQWQNGGGRDYAWGYYEKEWGVDDSRASQNDTQNI